MGRAGRGPGRVVWCYRIFWLSWVLFLFNLIPAYPLDGGQFLQSSGLGANRLPARRCRCCVQRVRVAVLFLIVSIWQNEALFMGLALFMLYLASMALYRLEMDDGPFGYDFSAGYTSLEKDDDAAAQAQEAGPVQALAAGARGAAAASAKPRSEPATRSGWTSSSKRSPAAARTR